MPLKDQLQSSAESEPAQREIQLGNSTRGLEISFCPEISGSNKNGKILTKI